MYRFPDACKFGIGAGLFQSPASVAASLVDTSYFVLGLPSWCTQAELDKRFQSLKRDFLKTTCAGKERTPKNRGARQKQLESGQGFVGSTSAHSAFQVISDAYEKVSTPEKRKTYDIV